MGGGLSGSTKIVAFAPMFFTGSFVNWNDPNISLSLQVHKSYQSNFHMTPCYSFGSMILYSSNLQSDPCSRIGFGNYGAGMAVGGYNSGQNISVVDLSNLPARIRNIYPASWLVP